MRVLVANNCARVLHELAQKYPKAIGHLYSPDGFRGPFPHLPYALDNGAFPAWAKGRPWDEAAFFDLCDRAAASGQPPTWVVVPDVVADRDQTLYRWRQYAPQLRRLYGWPLAFAVQDGMSREDVPSDADLIFVGGSTRWKWSTVGSWCAQFPRVHVARVNTERRLWQCWRLGAESTDGTGWMRGDPKQRSGLFNYVERLSAGDGPDPRIEVTDLFGDYRYLGGRCA